MYSTIGITSSTSSTINSRCCCSRWTTMHLKMLVCRTTYSCFHIILIRSSTYIIYSLNNAARSVNRHELVKSTFKPDSLLLNVADICSCFGFASFSFTPTVPSLARFGVSNIWNLHVRCLWVVHRLRPTVAQRSTTEA